MSLIEQNNVVKKREIGKIMKTGLPSYNKVKLSYLLTMLKEINLQPSYQRDITWNFEDMSNLIITIMWYGMISGITLYRLQGNERENSPYKYECIDGHHRLSVIMHYMTSTPINGKYVYWKHTDHKTSETVYVFYKPTPELLEWCNNHKTIRNSYSFLDDEELDLFNDYDIEIRIIQDYMTFQERKKQFSIMQNGKKVVNTDLLKNYTENRFIELVAEKEYNDFMNEYVLPKCTKVAKNYRTQWLVRMWYLYNSVVDKIESFDYTNTLKRFVMKDSEIAGRIKNYCQTLRTTLEKENDFIYVFEKFANFLKSLYDNIKLNPTQLFALFTHLCNNIERDTIDSRLETMKTHMRFWAKKGSIQPYKMMWENSLVETRKLYFKQCLEELDSFTCEAREPERKPITKTLKKNVWKKYFGKVMFANCQCGVEIGQQDFECGHIKSYATGGLTELNNLRPVCKDCNRSMGIMHMDEYYENKIFG